MFKSLKKKLENLYTNVRMMITKSIILPILSRKRTVNVKGTSLTIK